MAVIPVGRLPEWDRSRGLRPHDTLYQFFSLIQCYDFLARQLCRETDISNDEFRELADSLFNNYSRTFQNKSGTLFNSPRGKILRDLGTDLFCLTDCANPNIDFAGGLIFANNRTAEQLNIPEDRRVNVSGSGYSIVKGSPKAINRINRSYTVACPGHNRTGKALWAKLELSLNLALNCGSVTCGGFVPPDGLT